MSKAGDTSKKNYLIPKDTLEKIDKECEKDTNITLYALQYHLAQDVLNMHMISLLCESCLLSHRIKEIVQDCLKYGAESKNDKDVVETTIAGEKLFLLQAMVTAKRDLSVILRDNPNVSVMEN